MVRSTKQYYSYINCTCSIIFGLIYRGKTSVAISMFFFGTKRHFYTLIIMILINKGQSNKVVLTLTEKVTLSIPVFLFRFVSDVTNVEYAFIMNNTSIYKDRYDEFLLVEGTTVTLSPNGFYHYYVYEQSSPSNLDYKLALNLLEVGKVELQSTTITEPITQFESTDEYKAFEQ